LGSILFVVSDLFYCLGAKAQQHYGMKYGVPFFVDSSGTLEVFFDCGAQPTCIYTNARPKLLGFSFYFDAFGLPGVGRRSKIEFNSKELGLLRLKAVQFKKKEGCRADWLLLGGHFLKGKIMMFNQIDSTFSVLSSDQLHDELIANSYEILPLKKNIFDDSYRCSVSDQNRHFYALVDQGSSAELVVKDFKFNRRNDFEKCYETLTILAGGVKRRSMSYYGLKKFKIGTKEVEVFVKVSKRDDCNLLGFPYFLGFKRVIFDFPNRRIYTLGERNFKKNRFSELVLGLSNGQLVVNAISIASAYYRSGFRAGDRVHVSFPILPPVQQMECDQIFRFFEGDSVSLTNLNSYK